MAEKQKQDSEGRRECSGTSENIRSHLEKLGEELLVVNRCDVDKKNGWKYIIDVDKSEDITEHECIDLVMTTLNEKMPLRMELTKSHYDLESRIVMHTRIKRSKEGSKPKNIEFVIQGENKEGPKDTATTFSHRQVKLYTSKSTMTERKGEVPQGPTGERKGVRREIPLDYKKTNNMYLMGYMTNERICDQVRLVLAYLRYHKNGHNEGQTYVSIGMKLRTKGFPSDDKELEKIYVEFGKSQGFSQDEVLEDLQTYRRYLYSKKGCTSRRYPEGKDK